MFALMQEETWRCFKYYRSKASIKVRTSGSVENSVFSHAIKTFDTLKMNERTWSLSFIRRPWKQNKTTFWTNQIVQSKTVLSNRSLQPVQRISFNDTTETKNVRGRHVNSLDVKSSSSSPSDEVTELYSSLHRDTRKLDWTRTGLVRCLFAWQPFCYRKQPFIYFP